jgi:transposase InsO family protein
LCDSILAEPDYAAPIVSPSWAAVARIMGESGLQVRRLRRFVRTTDSDHESPIFPNLAADMIPDGPNQLWVADLSYVAIAVGFVYVAVILDAWSRRVVAMRCRGELILV